MTVKSAATGIITISALAGNAPVLYDFTSLQTVTVGSGGSATISFTSIPQTYTHLQIRFTARSAVSAANAACLVKFNSDTSSNYTNHQIYGNGSTAGSNNFGGSPRANMYLGQISGATATAGIFGVGIIDIIDYANIYKNKTARALNGQDSNGSGDIDFRSGAWMSTSAITRIDITEDSAANFAQYSSFALYGIK